MAHILKAMGHVPDDLSLEDEADEAAASAPASAPVEEIAADENPTQIPQQHQPQQNQQHIQELTPNASTLSNLSNAQTFSSEISPVSSSTNYTESHSSRGDGGLDAQSTSAFASTSASVSVSTSVDKSSPPKVVSIRAFEQNLGHQPKIEQQPQSQQQQQQQQPETSMMECQTETTQIGDLAEGGSDIMEEKESDVTDSGNVSISAERKSPTKLEEGEDEKVAKCQDKLVSPADDSISEAMERKPQSDVGKSFLTSSTYTDSVSFFDTVPL